MTIPGVVHAAVDLPVSMDRSGENEMVRSFILPPIDIIMGSVPARGAVFVLFLSAEVLEISQSS